MWPRERGSNQCMSAAAVQARRETRPDCCGEQNSLSRSRYPCVWKSGQKYCLINGAVQIVDLFAHPAGGDRDRHGLCESDGRARPRWPGAVLGDRALSSLQRRRPQHGRTAFDRAAVRKTSAPCPVTPSQTSSRNAHGATKGGAPRSRETTMNETVQRARCRAASLPRDIAARRSRVRGMARRLFDRCAQNSGAASGPCEK